MLATLELHDDHKAELAACRLTGDDISKVQCFLVDPESAIVRILQQLDIGSAKSPFRFQGEMQVDEKGKLYVGYISVPVL